MSSFARLLAVVALASLAPLPPPPSPSHRADARQAVTAPVSSLHATSALIAADPRTRRVFACARDASTNPGPADHLVVTDEVEGGQIAAPTMGCAGIVVNSATGHILVDDEVGHLAVLDPSTLRALRRIPVPRGTLVGAVPLRGRLALASTTPTVPG